MVHQLILFHNFDVNRYHFSPAPQKAHLSNLETFDGLKDVMALCGIIELNSPAKQVSHCAKMAESAADQAGDDGTHDTITITRFLLPHPHLQELDICSVSR